MPRTDAGRALLRTLDYIGAHSADSSFPMALEDVDAIEAEAHAQGRAEALAAVESYARTNAALVAGRGQTDDILVLLAELIVVDVRAAIDNLDNPQSG